MLVPQAPKTLVTPLEFEVNVIFSVMFPLQDWQLSHCALLLQCLHNAGVALVISKGLLKVAYSNVFKIN